ncbi:MAG: alpha-2-macroglobulin [Legionella sp.]|nr:alpha-2-macroglobulin [Legionella sp.]
MNNKTISKKTTRIGSFFALILGRVNWNSPPWLTSLRQKACNNPKSFWGLTSLIIALIIGATCGYIWYENQPKPRLVTASITAPQITPVAETMVPDSLTIDFGYKAEEFTPQSVAPLNAVNKEVTQGIELSPGLKGKWVWDSDSRLLFIPDEEWPAGQIFEVKFSKDFFASGTKMESFHYSFATKPFEAKIREFTFYQDPVNVKIRQVVATIEFNFPVDTASFESKTSLLLQALKNSKSSLESRQYNFTVSYDEHKRVAYLRSETLSIPDVSRYLSLTIAEGVKSASDTAKTETPIARNLLIPDVSSYFKVTSADASIVRNEQDRPEQILNIETTLGVTEKALNKSLHVFLLPQNYPATQLEQEKLNYEWQNPGEVSANILTLSTPLTLQGLPADRNYATLHSYKFKAQSPRYLFIKIDKGTRGFGDFALTNDFVTVVKVPEFPKEIGFLHKGALLALSSEKKLSILVRGLPAVKFEIARVLPDNINQLVTQTDGDFNNPYFINQSFTQQNISQIFSEIQQFDASDLTKQQYTALDMAKYLSAPTNPEGMQGLFLLQATGWDVTNNTPLDVKANRLILITDLGMIVKDNNDGSHDVFVQSIINGLPLAAVDVTILGKNGLPILTRTTDEEGRVTFPTLKDFVEDREPTVYLARIGSDVSFIPYNNSNRQLNFSRFDTGGIYNNPELNSLTAFIFSDRGIYRPGDTAHIGMIVKRAFAAPQAAGFPLQATITDPRGTTILDQKYTLDATGFLTIDFSTNATSPTGQYFINLYTVKDNHADSLLGSTSIRVAEFQPDRMRITSKLSPEQSDGWVSPTGLLANVGLWNLYGAPAVDRRIIGKILLTPQPVKFDDYPDYIFADPLVNPEKPPKVFTETLTEVKTNEQGEAQFDLNLDRFEKATYQLIFFAEGFEAQGGRSVTTQTTALVSPLPYFIGYKPDGDLNYIKQNSQRRVNFIALNPQLKQQPVASLKMQLLSLHPVTTLVKKENGTYQYQSIIKTTVLNTQPFAVNEEGSDFTLPTDQIGEFALSILDENNSELSRVKFDIVGASQLPLAKNAELSVKLSKAEFNAGEDIELQITAPYTGAGLITIERDKVYSTQWFKTDTTSSVQKIHIPEDFQGDGYVNVAFVRNWDSPDIFISPLSYSVVPFTINNSNHAVQIDLDTPKLARPGDAFKINYKTDKPGKIVVFAVDEGILQVGKYATPDPLAFFFQKHALEVLTQQTVDQILPKYIQDREISSVGGDGGEELLASHLNPFKRKTDLPVVYWSGIIDADSTSRELVYQIPDYFNGTLRVMAVAVSTDAVGAAEKQSEIRGDFIINPNVPAFVSPRDEFEITASIANNVKDSGVNAEVSIALSVSPELEIISSAKETRTIGEGQEQTVRFKLHANPELGAGKVTFVAQMGDKTSTMNATISVRPASQFLTSIDSGKTSAVTKTLPITRSIYPDYREVDLVVANSPLILVAGLQRYLDNFPYGCTEQLISKAMPLLAMKNQPWFIKDATAAAGKITTTIQMLGQRQMSNGGFSYWPTVGDNVNNTFASIYAMHFLTEARALGYNVPNDLLFAGIAYLKDLAGQNATNLDSARLQAYAIYVLTRNEMVTTNYLTNLQLYLDEDKSFDWKEDITGAYIASTYQLLKNSTEAQRLIDAYKPQNKTVQATDFYESNIADAQYLYLIARHFPERLQRTGDKLLMPLVAAINSEEINTILSSYISMALAAFAETNQPLDNATFSITETLNDTLEKNLVATNSNFEKVAVNENAKEMTIANPEKQTLFYQLTQSGFDKDPSTDSLKQGIEIYREFRSLADEVIDSTTLGTEIEVHIRARALDNKFLNNIVIVDLLPGGFEVVADSVKTEAVEYADVREDRVNFFTSLTPDVIEIVYRIKAISAGYYTLPPAFAESMYDPAIKARTVTGNITVAK